MSVEPAESEPTELAAQARWLIDLATEQGLVLRLLGGLAIQLLTPELPARTRTGQDLDFGSVRSSRKGLTTLLEQQGFVGDRNFNALYGDKQLYFTHGETGLAIDVMVDRIHMCHTVEFADRATELPYTLSPTDLLLSKLQIVELNDKDLEDILRLLVHFPVAEGDDADGDRARRDRSAGRRRLGMVQDDLAQPRPDLGGAGGRNARGDRWWGARSRRGRADAPSHACRRPEEPALEAARPSRGAQALV